ncbi:hypothetical protein MJ575_20450 [Klebsiella pneumoniae]|nr:hypothetical protein MJ575_20450 [Klebsiella pneumoniae]
MGKGDIRVRLPCVAPSPPPAEPPQRQASGFLIIVIFLFAIDSLKGMATGARRLKSAWGIFQGRKRMKPTVFIRTD